MGLQCSAGSPMCSSPSEGVWGSERANISSRVSYPALGVRSNVQKGPFDLLPDLYQSIALSMTILELLEHG